MCRIPFWKGYLRGCEIATKRSRWMPARFHTIRGFVTCRKKPCTWSFSQLWHKTNFDLNQWPGSCTFTKWSFKVFWQTNSTLLYRSKMRPTWQTVMPATGVPVKMEGEETKRKRMVKMLLLRPRCSRSRLLGFHVWWFGWKFVLWWQCLNFQAEHEKTVWLAL